MKTSPFYLLFAIILLSCNPAPERRVNQESIREELKDREVKRVTEGEIMEAARKAGDTIAAVAQSTLMNELKTAMASGGVSEAIRYCNIAAHPIVDSLGDRYQAEIKRTSLKVRNPENRPTEIEQQALLAYQQSRETGGHLSPNLVDQDETILYTKPIVIQNPLCLNCHGEVGKEVSSDAYEIIRNLYPQDEATGFEEGDLRGMWSIELSKKEVIRSL